MRLSQPQHPAINRGNPSHPIRPAEPGLSPQWSAVLRCGTCARACMRTHARCTHNYPLQHRYKTDRYAAQSVGSCSASPAGEEGRKVTVRRSAKPPGLSRPSERKNCAGCNVCFVGGEGCAQSSTGGRELSVTSGWDGGGYVERRRDGYERGGSGAGVE
jgi:hypothetical protein